MRSKSIVFLSALRWFILLLLGSLMNGCVADESKVIGDLGGMPVSISREYVNLVEYDGDPSWLERTAWKPTGKTFKARLNSFGILVHYPTMQPLTAANRKAYESRGFWDQDWINVTVISGGNLDRAAELLKTDPTYHFFKMSDPGDPLSRAHGDRYQYLGEKFGLKQYRLTGTSWVPFDFDDNNREHSPYNRRVFVRHVDDIATTLIRCGSGLTSAPGGRKTCHHSFLLLPDSMTKLTISYGPEMLENWRDYEQTFRQLVLSWRVAGPASVKPVAAPSFQPE